MKVNKIIISFFKRLSKTMKINILKITLGMVGYVHIMFCSKDGMIDRKGVLSNLNGII
jgi:hypothetical protein